METLVAGRSVSGCHSTKAKGITVEKLRKKLLTLILPNEEGGTNVSERNALVEVLQSKTREEIRQLRRETQYSLMTKNGFVCLGNLIISIGHFGTFVAVCAPSVMDVGEARTPCLLPPLLLLLLLPLLLLLFLLLLLLPPSPFPSLSSFPSLLLLPTDNAEEGEAAGNPGASVSKAMNFADPRILVEKDHN